MRVTKHLFGFKLSYAELEKLDTDRLYKILRDMAGKWCKLPDKRGVGTILYLIEGNIIYCQSLVKVKNVATIEHFFNIKLDESINFKVRLPTDLETAHRLSDRGVIDVNLNKNEFMQVYIENLLSKNGMQLAGCGWDKLDNDQGLHPRPVLIDNECSDFTINAIVKDVSKVKKAYVYGLGIKRHLGFGMMIPVTQNHYQ